MRVYGAIVRVEEFVARRRWPAAGDIRPANPVVMRLCQLRFAPTKIT
jgi:hypothetical protein